MLSKLLTTIPQIAAYIPSHGLHQSVHMVIYSQYIVLTGLPVSILLALCHYHSPDRTSIIRANPLQHDSIMASPSSKPAISRAQAEQLARQNLLGIFGERDESKRLAQMQETYDEDIAFYDPDKLIKGFDVINEFISQLLDSNPEWAFRPCGNVWVNSDLVMLEWEFGPAGQTAPARGNDVMFVNDEGKIAKMYTMIQGVSDA